MASTIRTIFNGTSTAAGVIAGSTLNMSSIVAGSWLVELINAGNNIAIEASIDGVRWASVATFLGGGGTGPRYANFTVVAPQIRLNVTAYVAGTITVQVVGRIESLL